MTQKELAYFEDAIGHEKNIISICEESLKKIEDNSIIEFLNKELEIHQNTKDKLLNKLEEKANE